MRTIANNAPKTSRTLSVGDVAKRSGIAVSALHFYESEGLIHCWRTTAGHRRYGRDVLRRIAVIRIAQSAGLSLKDIAAALSTLPEGRTPTAGDWAKLSAGWRDMLTNRIEKLTRLRDNLVGCICCGERSILPSATSCCARPSPGFPASRDPGRRSCAD